jgi:hypothetical protein
MKLKSHRRTHPTSLLGDAGNCLRVDAFTDGASGARGVALYALFFPAGWRMVPVLQRIGQVAIGLGARNHRKWGDFEMWWT